MDVLVIGDDRTADGILDALRKKELALDYAGNSVEAIRLLARKPFKVVLLDFARAVEEKDVLSFIGSLDERPNVIVMTDDGEQLDRSIVTTIMHKPVDFEQLAGFVRSTTLQSPH